MEKRVAALLGTDRVWHVAVPVLLIALGTYLRLSQYANDRSLFVDGALLARNIAYKDYAALTGPLQDDQRLWLPSWLP